MPTYEFRQPDGACGVYLLPSDRAAVRYAAALTERGVSLELWREGQQVTRIVGTREDLLPGAWLFHNPKPSGREI